MPRVFELDLDPSASEDVKAEHVAARLAGLVKEHGFYDRAVRVTREKEVVRTERAVFTFEDDPDFDVAPDHLEEPRR